MQAVTITVIVEIILVTLMFLVAPLGIWNRLIKIHRDNNRNAKAICDRLDMLNRNLTAMLESIDVES